MADSLFVLDPNSVLLLNFNEKKQVTSPEIFSVGGDITSVKLRKISLSVAKKAREVAPLSLGPGWLMGQFVLEKN